MSLGMNMHSTQTYWQANHGETYIDHVWRGKELLNIVSISIITKDQGETHASGNDITIGEMQPALNSARSESHPRGGYQR